MAKGNLMQGMAHGAIGDIVLTRINGEQVSRVRNRNPRNPKSPAQMYQRAIMATVMQAYSAGKSVFNHAFQGKSVGTDCQSLFMSLNLKRLRTQLAHEVFDDVLAEDLTAHCVYPGSISPVPNAYQISKGTYEQTVFTAEVVSNGVRFTLPQPNQNETIASYCWRVGLIPDDYYTFCFFLSGENVLYEAPSAFEDPLGQVFDCQFGFARLHVRHGVLWDEHHVADWIDIFEIDETDNCAPTFIYGPITSGITLEALDYQQNGAGSLGCIRSRKDKDLRSTSFMFCPSWGEVGINEFGLCAPYVLESWQAGTASLGDSDLVLEGGGGSPSAPTARRAFIKTVSGTGYLVNEAGQLLNINSTSSDYRFLTYYGGQWMAVELEDPTQLLELFGGSEHVDFTGTWEGVVLTGDMVLPAKDGMVETKYICTDDIWSPEIAAFPG